jgi:hypothetical protein
MAERRLRSRSVVLDVETESQVDHLDVPVVVDEYEINVINVTRV